LIGLFFENKKFEVSNQTLIFLTGIVFKKNIQQQKKTGKSD
jgi:hypothetical protein